MKYDLRMTYLVRRELENTIRRHAEYSGVKADYSHADLDLVLMRCGIDDSASGWAQILRNALRIADSEIVTQGRRNYWVQFINRITNRLVLAGDTAIDDCLNAMNSVTSETKVQELTFSERADVIASVSAAIAWGFFHESGSQWATSRRSSVGSAGPSANHPLFPTGRLQSDLAIQYTMLYILRFELRPGQIIRLLDGLDRHDPDPIRQSFGCFAHALRGDWAEAERRASQLTELDHLPLAASKLLGTAITNNPPLALGSDFANLTRLLQTSVQTWASVGCDPLTLVAQAELAAIRGDVAEIDSRLNEAADLMEESEYRGILDFASLAERRSRILERLALRNELSTAHRVRDEAQNALEVARSAATQAPLTVGVFTGVVALVIGATQVQQGLPAADRILVVGGLGAVLILFLLLLFVMLSSVGKPRELLRRFSLLGAGGFVLAAGLLLLLWRIASG